MITSPIKRVYRGPNIPPRLIRRYARAIAAESHPDKIILFGSYAYSTPHEDSDVYLLVIMPVRNQHDQAVRSRCSSISSLSEMPRRVVEWQRRPREEGRSTMTKAMLKNGQIIPLEPLPSEWKEGQEILLEAAQEQEADIDDISSWLLDVEEAASAIPAESDREFVEAIRSIRAEAKIQAQRELGAIE